MVYYRYKKILVEDVMSKNYVSLKKDDMLENAVNMLLEKNFTDLFIVDKDDKFKGIITLTDISKMMKKDKMKELKLKECMIENLITVKRNDSLLTCRDLMIKNKIGRLPVVEEKRLVGVIRKQEIMDYYYMSIEKDGMKLQHIVDNLYEAMCVIDEKGMVVFWNKSAEKLYGIAAKQIVGRLLEEFFPYAMDLKVLKTKKPVENKFHSPKENCHIVISSIPIFINGEFAGVVSTDKNISELEALSSELKKARDTVAFLKKEVERITNDGFKNVIGKSEKILKQIELSRQIAKTKVNVLITGESGTGKEVFARAIYECSEQKGLFIPINCSAIPNELFESEFFGYDEGAFTGANKKGKLGLFELANNGTIFLDEIGDLPMFMQAKLLRVLQDRVIRRVGGEKYIDVNARILSATHRDLKKMVKEGTFREDLYYRLDVIQIQLPPLRERGGDVALFIQKFIKELSKVNNKDVIDIDKETLDILQSYHWKGNIREIKNTMEHLVVLCRGQTITADLIPKYIVEATNKRKRRTGGGLDLNESIRELEIDMIEQALKTAKGNKAKAAKLLNIPRATLYYKIDSYKIDSQ